VSGHAAAVEQVTQAKSGLAQCCEMTKPAKRQYLVAGLIDSVGMRGVFSLIKLGYLLINHGQGLIQTGQAIVLDKG